MKRKAKAAIMAATMTLGCVNVLGSGAMTASAQVNDIHSLLTTEKIAMLEDAGMDLELIEESLLNSQNSNNDIHDFSVICYAKGGLLNLSDISIELVTSYMNPLIRYIPSGTDTCVYDYEYDDDDGITISPEQESVYTYTNRHVLRYRCGLDETPTTANVPIFCEMFTTTESGVSASDITVIQKKIHIVYDGTEYTFTDSSAVGTLLSYDILGLGDTNLDGEIDLLDVIFAWRIVAEDPDITWTDERKQRYAADVNLDGEVTSADATLIQQYIAGSFSSFFAKHFSNNS